MDNNQGLNLFIDDENIDDGIIDGLEVVNIDIEGISEEADEKAKTVLQDLTQFYYNEDFIKANPNFRKRVDNDIESLRVLLKMRQADEVTHDVLIKAIAGNSGNASLYQALTKIQTTILQITTKIETIVNNLTTMIKGYQMELNFKLEQEQHESDSEEAIDNATQHRGSKSFIEQMNRLEAANKEKEAE